MTPDKTPTEALAQLRHLYVQLKSQDGMSRADRSRIADGLLSPAIAALEKWGQTAQAAEPVAREPLTNGQIQDLLLCGNPTDEEMRLIRIGWDAAHGIKGGQHGAE